MSQTSLFAELVKDKNMRDLAIKRLEELNKKVEGESREQSDGDNTLPDSIMDCNDTGVTAPVEPWSVPLPADAPPLSSDLLTLPIPPPPVSDSDLLYVIYLFIQATEVM